jgi:chaperonin GroES
LRKQTSSKAALKARSFRASQFLRDRDSVRLELELKRNAKSQLTEEMAVPQQQAIVAAALKKYQKMIRRGANPMAAKIHLEPINDRVVVSIIPEDEKSKGGIIIPDSAKKDKPDEGIVFAVGPGMTNPGTGVRIEPQVRVGDRILFAKYGGFKVSCRDQDFWCVREDEIVGIIHEESDLVVPEPESDAKNDG